MYTSPDAASEPARTIGQLRIHPGTSYTSLRIFILRRKGSMSDSMTDCDYRRLLERSPAGLLITTMDGEILEANRASAEFLGYDTPEALKATNVREHYADAGQRQAMIERLREEGVVENVELLMETHGGEQKWLLASVNSDYDERRDQTLLLGTWVDVTKQRRLRERLEHLAQHDELTGLLNRRALFGQAEQVLAMCEREHRMAAVVYLDIAGFKQVNEQVGHQGGDEVLGAVGERLEETMRDSDLVARLGGDEFVVLATLLKDERDADQVARRVMFAFDQPFEGAGLPLSLQPAAGVAVYPEDGPDLDTLLHRADRALWGADRKKSPGFRRYQATVVGTEAPNWNVAEELQKALQTGEGLHQVFQPIVDAGDGNIVGLESLVRWEHPVHGSLTPGGFIPEAEATGLIRHLDRAVCRATMDQVAAWEEDGLVPDWVSMNLSAQTLSSPNCVEWIGEELQSRPTLVPKEIVLEITEHAAMQQITRNEVLQALDNQVGVSISIDDFGIGYSSLLYLRQFPADFLKIDKQFVQGIEESLPDQKVVQGIIALGKAFGLSLIAEGVEREAEREWLHKAGCDYLQGYLFGRPAVPEQVEEQLRTS